MDQNDLELRRILDSSRIKMFPWLLVQNLPDRMNLLDSSDLLGGQARMEAGEANTVWWNRNNHVRIKTVKTWKKRRD